MKERVELHQVREFGDVINDTILFFRQNFVPLVKAYLVICGFFLVAGTAVEIVSKLRDLEYDEATTPFNTSYWLTLLFSLVNSAVVMVTVYSYMALYREKDKEAPTVTEVWGYFRYFFFRVFLSNVVLDICILLGFVMCIIPGIYLLPALALVIPIMVMENTSLSYAFTYSFKLIKENWWFVLGIFLLIGLIYLAAVVVVVLPALIITGGAEWISGMKLNSTEIIASAIATNLARVFYIVPCITAALIYFSLSDQKHGTSLINRIHKFGKSNPGADQSSEQY